MTSRQQMKKDAKGVFKKHYMAFVLLCLIATLLKIEFTDSLNILSLRSTFTGEDSSVSTSDDNAENELTGVISHNNGLYDIIGNYLTKKETVSEDDKNAILGHSNGVLASAVNSVSSGSIYTTILAAILSFTGSKNVAVAIFIVLAFIVAMLFSIFFKNIYMVILRRFFLEGRTYSNIPFQRCLFLYKTRTWIKSSLALFRMTVFQTLWTFTIIGGVIKKYSYYMVPYIIAENPTITGKKAIKLSQKMMKGHKFQCFINDLSFFGWYILSAITLGLTNLFFLAPYKTAFFCEYYYQLRQEAINNNIPGCEYFTDKYLYEAANTELLEETYPDISKLMKEDLTVPECFTKGFRGFLAKYFSISLFNTKDEDIYEEKQSIKMHLSVYKDILLKKQYPGRLSPYLEKEKVKKDDNTKYLRHYSVCSLILLFFTFSLIGWLWEVSLHLVEDGVFVNRGVLHGPWLPIYGTGGIMILIVLNVFRKKPWLEFVTAVILCGIVEYFTSYYLEITHDGMKWWDYSGYFLNLNGRICAEGLFVFGMGGLGIVYILAPMLDNLYRKIKLQIVIPLCAILLLIYAGDNIYSKKYPNMGEGITDYTYNIVDTNLLVEKMLNNNGKI